MFSLAEQDFSHPSPSRVDDWRRIENFTNPIVLEPVKRAITPFSQLKGNLYDPPKCIDGSLSKLPPFITRQFPYRLYLERIRSCLPDGSPSHATMTTHCSIFDRRAQQYAQNLLISLLAKATTSSMLLSMLGGQQTIIEPPAAIMYGVASAVDGLSDAELGDMSNFLRRDPHFMSTALATVLRTYRYDIPNGITSQLSDTFRTSELLEDGQRARLEKVESKAGLAGNVIGSTTAIVGHVIRDPNLAPQVILETALMGAVGIGAHRLMTKKREFRIRFAKSLQKIEDLRDKYTKLLVNTPGGHRSTLPHRSTKGSRKDGTVYGMDQMNNDIAQIASRYSNKPTALWNALSKFLPLTPALLGISGNVVRPLVLMQILKESLDPVFSEVTRRGREHTADKAHELIGELHQSIVSGDPGKRMRLLQQIRHVRESATDEEVIASGLLIPMDSILRFKDTTHTFNEDIHLLPGIHFITGGSGTGKSKFLQIVGWEAGVSDEKITVNRKPALPDEVAYLNPNEDIDRSDINPMISYALFVEESPFTTHLREHCKDFDELKKYYYWSSLGVEEQPPEHLDHDQKVIIDYLTRASGIDEHDLREIINGNSDGNKSPRKSADLSDGQRTRLNTIMKIEMLRRGSPKLLLVDEPTARLDYENKKVILDYLKQLIQDDPEVVVLIASNDVAELTSITKLLQQDGTSPPIILTGKKIAEDQVRWSVDRKKIDEEK